GDGVLAERLERFHRILGRVGLHAQLGQGDNGAGGRAAEDLPDLAHLVPAARGEDEGRGHCPSAARWRSISRATPRAARSRSSSSCGRVKVPCSPVPCTSTSSPDSRATTFMSTRAATSSAYSRSRRGSSPTNPTPIAASSWLHRLRSTHPVPTSLAHSHWVSIA